MSISLVHGEAFQASGSVMDLPHIPAIVMFVAFTVMIAKLKWHPVVYIAIAAAIGVAMKF